MTLTGWNCQQGHEHASAVDSMRCNDAHAALKAMEATVQALTAENEALRVKLSAADHYGQYCAAANEYCTPLTFAVWFEQVKPLYVESSQVTA